MAGSPAARMMGLAVHALAAHHEARMKDITFTITPCAATGGFVARWDDAPGRGGITTQGDSFAELDAMIADAVNGYFEAPARPQRVRLHFVEDPVVSLG